MFNFLKNLWNSQPSTSEVQQQSEVKPDSSSEVQPDTSESQLSDLPEVQKLYQLFNTFGTPQNSLVSVPPSQPQVVEDEDFWFNQGFALYNLGRKEEAIASYDKALDIKPDFYQAWTNRGIALSDLGRKEEAITSHDKALDINPDFYQAWTNRGIALSDLGRKEEAITSYDKALDINPDFYQAWFNRGNALYELGRNEEAIASHDKALDINPDLYQAWFNRGNALSDLGRREEAIASHDKALDIKPDLYQAWTNRGVALSDLGRKEEAIASYNKALDINPDDYQTWTNRGLTLSDLGRKEEAIASLDKALEIKPDYYQAWFNRGNALSDLGRKEEAIASLDKALEIKPDYYQAWNNRAWAICGLSQNRLSSPSLLTLLQKKPIEALKNSEPHIYALREAFPHLTANTPPWGQIYRFLGDAYLEHSNYKENARPYWRDAQRSYETALPILTAETFPEDHLEVLQGLIRTNLALNDTATARYYQQQGSTLFAQLRAQKPDHLKPAFETKFSSFSQLEIDLLIDENHPIDALQQAEFYKNRCLTWILDSWQEKPESPDYSRIQTLINSQTAIIYWHLSIDNLTTFVIIPNSDSPIVLESNRRQQAQEFEKWQLDWDNKYSDYSSKKNNNNERKDQHPWRIILENRLEELKKILQINNISKLLPETITNLILIPHRDLHRFPLHTLFPENITCTYLPSVQIGLKLGNNQQQNQTYIPLLSVEDPTTDQQPMPYAQLESAIIRYLVQNADCIAGEKASIKNVLNALKNEYTTFHFTGHGYYNSLKPEESAIALTDEMLTARDISQLKTLSNYRLICLVACETALTGKKSIETEYVGLGSAFLKAGVSNVLSTLWQVEEISSAWLIIYFYQRLLVGDSPAIALKVAQNWLKNVTKRELSDWITQLSQLSSLEPGIIDILEARAKNTLEEGDTIELDQPTEYSHPYYWTAFTLIGYE